MTDLQEEYVAMGVVLFLGINLALLTGADWAALTSFFLGLFLVACFGAADLWRSQRARLAQKEVEREFESLVEQLED